MPRQTGLGRPASLTQPTGHRRTRGYLATRNHGIGLRTPGDRRKPARSGTDVPGTAKKRETESIPPNLVRCEIKQMKPVDQAPRARRHRTGPKPSRTARSQALAQRPQRQWVKSKHHDLSAVAKHSGALTQQRVRLGHLLQSVRDHERVNAAAGQRQMPAIEDDICCVVFPDAKPPLAQRTRALDLAPVEAPATDLNTTITGQAGQQLSQQTTFVLHKQTTARAGQPLRGLTVFGRQ